MAHAISLPRLAGLLLALALAVPGAALWASPAGAQQEPEFFDVPFAPGQWNIGRRLDESELRYCVDPRDPAWEVDGDIAEALAQGLLLEPQRYVVQSEIISESFTKVYEIMLKHCDVHMGFKLIPEGYPDWVILTRGYYRTGYVYVTRDPDLQVLSALPPGRAIAVTVGSSAHLRLVSYQKALPPEKRWPAYPYGTDDDSLQALLAGTVDVAVVWGPSFWAEQRDNPAFAGIHIIDSAPVPPTELEVGAIMLEQNKFLRAAVDEAIAALGADGTIQAILDKHGFPAAAGP